MDGPEDYHTKWRKLEKDKHHLILLICGIFIKNDINELNYKTDLQTERMNLQLPGESGAGGGIVRELGMLCIYTQLYLK